MSLRLSLRASERTLARRAENAQHHWHTRSSCIITLAGDNSLLGHGEAAPLPGFSPDTLQACETALIGLDLSHLPTRLADGQSLLAELAAASGLLPKKLPVARAALEGALLDLWSRAAGQPAWALLAGDGRPPAQRPNPPPVGRRVAALLMGEPEQAVAQALSARSRGVNAFKLKVGRAGAFERELAAVKELRAVLGPEATLRLDANRAWSREQAARHLSALAAHHPEFLEEPCAFAELAQVSPSAVALALDESLAQLSPADAAQLDFAAWRVCALVLKPTLLGGISACCAWAGVARACGAAVVLSHAFEGPLGLAVSAALALSIGSEDVAHGLDLEGARLEHLRVPFFADGRIQPWDAPGFGDLELDS